VIITIERICARSAVDRIVVVVAIDDVIAAFTEERVIVVSTVDRIIPITATHRIISAIGIDRVGETGTDDHIIAIRARECSGEVHARIRRTIHDVIVVAIHPNRRKLTIAARASGSLSHRNEGRRNEASESDLYR